MELAASPRVVVMGVSGCGKSTVGQGLAQALGVPYLEGDELHPPQNVARMAQGIALTDEDRAGWLSHIAQRLQDAQRQGRGLVVTCSALKRRYRDTLRGGASDVRFVHLHGDEALLQQRMALRNGHYMPASLLKSQLQTLEAPGDDEQPIRLGIDLPPEALVAAVAAALREPRAASQNPSL
jgi:gluconokinase